MDDPMLINEVLEAERAWTQAHRTLDLTVIEHLMGEDYTIIRPGGEVVGRAEALASYESATRAWDYADSDDYLVRVYGEVAVVIGRWRARGHNGGEAFDYAARFTAVYVKRDGRWQIVADQSTPIASAE